MFDYVCFFKNDINRWYTCNAGFSIDLPAFKLGCQISQIRDHCIQQKIIMVNQVMFEVIY